MNAGATGATANAGARVSVLMPTFEQAAFLPSAVASVRDQSVRRWELVIVDDGSCDQTAAAITALPQDSRIRSLRLETNRGLGAALNAGLDVTVAPVIAYLPSDDRWYRDHLAALLDALDDDIVLAWSGVRHHGTAESLDGPDGFGLQLVQTCHRRTADRWIERAELESDDLERLYWRRLRTHGATAATGTVTCEWVDHPAQRHKAIRESFDGGINVFRNRYRVATPLRFHSSDSGDTDEVSLYRRFRERPSTPPAGDGLKILLVGALAYNPERVLALEERGHRLYGLWSPDGLGMSTVGPLPFGHVTDLPRDRWHDAVREVAPDVIYGLLNWRAIPFVHAVLEADVGIPFVWHFKESPWRALANGTWPQLVDLVTRSDATIFATEEERQWFTLMLPGLLDAGRTHVIDGDLPKADWFTDDMRPRLSDTDGQIHTVVLGRPLGIDASVVTHLARRGVHTHLYGQVRAPGPKGRWRTWIDEARREAPGHVHVHPHVDQRDWVSQLSRFDAGWLHRVPSRNGGDLRRATWDDLNCPARLPPLVGAGLPLLQPRSRRCAVAVERLLSQHGMGLLYEDLDDLSAQLADRTALDAKRARVRAARRVFTFDHHADDLLAVFQSVL